MSATRSFETMKLKGETMIFALLLATEVCSTFNTSNHNQVTRRSLKSIFTLLHNSEVMDGTLQHREKRTNTKLK